MTATMRTISSAARPRSDVRAYALRADYLRSADRVTLTYSVPLIPRPWIVATEDPLEGLWIDPDVAVSDLLKDLPNVRRFMGIPKTPETTTAAEALDRLADLLRDLDDLL